MLHEKYNLHDFIELLLEEFSREGSLFTINVRGESLY